MPSDHTTRSNAVPVRNGVVMLTGYGVKVSVDRRQLTVSDGVGRQRRAGRFAKATGKIKRLVVLAETGHVTFEALRWLRDTKAIFSQLDHEANLLTVSVDGLDDARLRRAQAFLPNADQRLPVARELIEAKIRAQLAVIDSFGLPNTGEIEKSLIRLEKAKQIDGALIAEGRQPKRTGTHGLRFRWNLRSVISFQITGERSALDVLRLPCVLAMPRAL